MPFIESPCFPETIAYGAAGGPEYSTSLPESPSGFEATKALWAYPRHRYQLGLAVRNDTDTRALFAFFHAVGKGRWQSFRFPDFNAGEAVGLDEPLGTGTGAEEDYELVKRYADGGLTLDRPITKPRAGTVTIKSNGTPTGSFTVDTTTGIVTMTATSGHVLTASFAFDVPVRFAIDRLAMQRVDGGYLWGSIELVETRDYL